MTRVSTAILVLAVTASAVSARPPSELVPTLSTPDAIGPRDGTLVPETRFVLAATNTTLLASYSFDSGTACSPQGWTAVDATAQTAVFWHIDDFVGANVNPGDSLAVLAGARSLWCGARAASSGSLCGYATLPGYGNDWDQVWTTKDCIPVIGGLDVSFLMSIDCEANWDYVSIEYTTECSPDYTDWILNGGVLDQWSGNMTIAHVASYPVADGPVRVRLRFRSESFYSDEDGRYDSHAGAVVIDNLTVEGLSIEDFEDDAVGATVTEDWESGFGQPFGLYMALFPGATLAQEDQCARTVGCTWAAISGSTNTYACGGLPNQRAVPLSYSYLGGKYIDNEIWSPHIPISGSGNVLNLELSVYLDIGQGDLVFYTWDIRTITADGCATPWRNRGYLYSGQYKQWVTVTFPIGDLVDLSAGVAIQTKLAVVDMCQYWCMGFGICHSHSPLFAGVRVYRVDISGPVWTARDIDMFQDTFPSDGSDTGVGRADAAIDIAPWNSPTLAAGDSAAIVCFDRFTAIPVSNPSGLAEDIGLSGKQCYLWVHVTEKGVPSVTKTGAILSGGPEYPFKDTQAANGRMWTRIQCRLRNVNRNTFVVDLNDNLFEAGDVVEFFFGATNTTGLTSYCSGSTLNYVQSDVNLAAETAAEFSVLPVNGGMLYVDGMDGRGAQAYWDDAFEILGISPDRFDVRSGHMSTANRPSAHVTDASVQLSNNYTIILWDVPYHYGRLADGVAPSKSDDYAIINEFLGNLNTAGGIYLCGDALPSSLNGSNGPSAISFKSTFIPYVLAGSSHDYYYGVSPAGTGATGGAFDGDAWVIYGGCPALNMFDVMTPTGLTVMQSSYGATTANNGAEISKVTGNARVMMAGYSFIYIRDDEEDGIGDRAKHLYDILTYLGGAPGEPTDAPAVLVDRLEQNYPNPFNPQTTIAFSLKERARVRVDVFNVAGQLVRTLLDETRAPGAYEDVRWDGRDAGNRPAASGVYFYRLSAGDFLETRKMVILK